jgi:hypothetical protein
LSYKTTFNKELWISSLPLYPINPNLRMTIETSFAKKVTGPQDRDHRFLALLGNDGEFDLALLTPAARAPLEATPQRCRAAI